MVSTKRIEEGRSVTPSTEKKKRRTSLEPAELPTAAEQRQRAKEWAEKQKLDKTAPAATESMSEEKPERKKRETKTLKNDDVFITQKVSRRSKKEPEIVVESIEIPVKIQMRSRKETISVVEPVKIPRRTKREPEQLVESSGVEDAPVVKKVKVKSTKPAKEEIVSNVDVPFPADKFILNTDYSVEEESPFRSSAVSVSNSSTASKSTTPFKKFTSPIKTESISSPESPVISPAVSPVAVKRGLPLKTPVKSEQVTAHSPYLAPPTQEDREEKDELVVEDKSAHESTVERHTVDSDLVDSECCCATMSDGTCSALRYVFVALVLASWVFALYLDQTVGVLALGGFALLFLLKRVACVMCVERTQGVPPSESSDYYLAPAASRELKRD